MNAERATGVVPRDPAVKRVLLTGGAGFIGSACVGHLVKAGFEVHGVSRAARSTGAPVAWHQADLLEPGAAAALVARVRPTHLLHLAWYAEPGLYWRSGENYRWVGATLELVHAFVAAGGTRVVAAGTCAEYDWRHGWCSEAVTPLAPATPYGVCKNALRAMLEACTREAGASFAWGRVFFLYGPGEHPSRLVASVVGALLRAQPALCTSGEQVRDFLHVSDVAGAFAALVDGDAQGAVNIGSGEPVAVRDVVAAIARRLGCPDLVRLGARPAPPSEPPLLVADARRLRDEAGWRPLFGLEAGLEDTIRWWRETDRAPLG